MRGIAGETLVSASSVTSAGAAIAAAIAIAAAAPRVRRSGNGATNSRENGVLVTAALIVLPNAQAPTRFTGSPQSLPSAHARAPRGRGVAAPAGPAREAASDREGGAGSRGDAEDDRPAAPHARRRGLRGGGAAGEAIPAPDRRPRARAHGAPDERRTPALCRRRCEGPEGADVPDPVPRRRRARAHGGGLEEAGRRVVAPRGGARVRARASRAGGGHARDGAAGLDPRRRLSQAAFAAARPAADRRHRARVGERDPLDGAAVAVRALDPARRLRGGAARCCDPGGDGARARQARPAVPPLRQPDPTRRLRGAHRLLLQRVPDRRPRPQGPPPLAAPEVTPPLLVSVRRGDVVEALHRVHVAFTDGRSHGDPELVCFLRSSAKPLQAVPFVEGYDDLPDAEIAIACASHRAEPAQLAAVRRVLERAGATVDDLENGLQEGRPGGKLGHNCSGKHAGMLAACRANGWPLHPYRDPSHPLQARIAELIGGRATAVDGCGVPTFAMSLREAAALLTRVPPRIREAMRARPELVGGSHGAADTDLMCLRDGWIAKGGAEGLFCAAHEDGLGLALKVEDGAYRAIRPALGHVLGVGELLETPVTNSRGETVGVISLAT